MSVIGILPFLSILFIGDALLKLFYRITRKPVQFNFREHMIIISFLGLATLIFPSLFFGILFKNVINIYMYLFFGVSMLWGVYLLWMKFFNLLSLTLQNISSFDFNTLNEFELESKGLISIVNTIVITEYIIMVLLGPVKGWDALHFYIPHGYVIYLLNYIPTVDPLNFIPMFKPPLVPLLVTFTYYTTKDANLYWIPIFFLLLSVILIYQFSRDLGFSELLAALSVSFYLFTPLTYFLFFDWPYYQDLPIMVMASGVMWLTLRLYKVEYKNNWDLYFVVLILVLGLSPLTKLSGYVFYFIYFLFIPGSKLWRHVKSSVILLVGFLSSYRAMHNISIWTSLVIISFTVVMIIILETNDANSNWKHTFLYVIPLIIGLIPGVLWAYQIIFRVPEGKTVINTLFLHTNQAIQWGYTGDSIPLYFLTAEHAFMTSWVTSVFPIFLAALFAPTWLLPKLTGFFSIQDKHKTWLLLWLFGFYIVWLGNFSTVSIRYLTPILPPLAIITAQGFMVCYRKARKKLNTKGLVRGSMLLTLVFAYGSMYPTFPFEFLKYDAHKRLYLFHHEWYRILAYVIVITGFLVGIGYIDLISYKNTQKIYKNIRHFVFIIGMILIITMPLGPQGFVYYQYDYDLSRARGRWAIHTRPEVQELADAIIKLVPNDEVVLVENLPGLEWFTLHPILDLYSIRSFNLQSGWENTSRFHENLFNYSIKWIVTKSSYSLYYDEYVHAFYSQYAPFYFASNSLYGHPIYENQEFRLYELTEYYAKVNPRVISLSYGGIKNLFLTGEQVSYRSPEDKNVYLNYDISSLSASVTNMIILVNASYSDGTQNVFQITSIPPHQKQASISLFSVNTTIMLYSIKVLFYIGTQMIQSLILPATGNSILIHENGETNDSLIII